MFARLALGLFVSTSANTQAEAQQMAQLFLLPSVFLSGYIFPFEGTLFLRIVGKCLPAAYMVAIMRGVVLRGAGRGELWPNVLALATISTLLVYVSARRIHKVTAGRWIGVPRWMGGRTMSGNMPRPVGLAVLSGDP